jgi:hypothetical protein
MTESPLRLEGEDQELAVRTARKDGRQVVSLRSIVRASGEFVIECEVYPVSGLRVEPLTPGPYTFESSQDATRFVDEALEALTYLGCEVA